MERKQLRFVLYYFIIMFRAKLAQNLQNKLKMPFSIITVSIQEDMLPKCFIFTLVMGPTNCSFPELRSLDQITGMRGTFVRTDIIITYGIGMAVCK